MSITRHFKLGLNAGASLPLLIHANQYDHGEEWAFTLCNQDGSKYTPSSGSIIGIKSDKLGISVPGRIEGGDVIITESQQMTAAAGKAVFELLIDGETHGTANFVVLVEPRPGDGAVVSASDYSLFQEAINSIAIAGSGAPAVATLAAEMTDEGKVYLYAGSETGYTNGHWYYYNGSAWTDGGKYGGTVDATLTMSGVAADAKKTGDEISELKSEISSSQGLTAEFKTALENFAKAVAFKNNDPLGQTYIDALITAMNPPANLTRITAVYTQSGTVYNTDSLDSLKSDLVVTAHYDNGTSEVVSAYVLSGTLEEGTSTITAAYGGKTTTFDVTVTEYIDTFTYGLVDNSSAITGSYITDTGDIESATQQSGYYEDYIDLYGRSSVVIHYVPSSGTINFRISVYDANKVFTRQLHQEASNYATVELQSDERYIRLGWYLGATSYTCKFYIQSATPTNLVMEIGDINSSTGEDTVETRRIRSADYIPVSDTITVQDCPFAQVWALWVNSNNGYFFRCYDSSKTFLGTLIDGSTMYRDDISNVALPANTAFVRIIIQKNNNAFSTGFTNGAHPFAINGVSYLPVEE